MLKSEGKGIFYWRAGRAFDVHGKMRSHTEGQWNNR